MSACNRATSPINHAFIAWSPQREAGSTPSIWWRSFFDARWDHSSAHSVSTSPVGRAFVRSRSLLFFSRWRISFVPRRTECLPGDPWLSDGLLTIALAQTTGDSFPGAVEANSFAIEHVLQDRLIAPDFLIQEAK